VRTQAVSFPQCGHLWRTVWFVADSTLKV